MIIITPYYIFALEFDSNHKIFARLARIVSKILFAWILNYVIDFVKKFTSGRGVISIASNNKLI